MRLWVELCCTLETSIKFHQLLARYISPKKSTLHLIASVADHHRNSFMWLWLAGVWQRRRCLVSGKRLAYMCDYSKGSVLNLCVVLRWTKLAYAESYQTNKSDETGSKHSTQRSAEQQEFWNRGGDGVLLVVSFGWFFSGRVSLGELLESLRFCIYKGVACVCTRRLYKYCKHLVCDIYIYIWCCRCIVVRTRLDCSHRQPNPPPALESSAFSIQHCSCVRVRALRKNWSVDARVRALVKFDGAQLIHYI